MSIVFIVSMISKRISMYLVCNSHLFWCVVLTRTKIALAENFAHLIMFNINIILQYISQFFIVMVLFFLYRGAIVLGNVSW